MTQNQIAYWSLQETKRSNLIREAETERSNKAKETETNRSNVARETETKRSNLVNEGRNQQLVDAQVHRMEVQNRNDTANAVFNGIDKTVGSATKVAGLFS